MPLPLMPHQTDAARWLAPRLRAGLFDDMGVGKTVESINALDLRMALRGIVICPASLRDNWRGEFQKFATVFRRIVKATSIHDLLAWLRGAFDVLIISYELAAKWAKYIIAECEPIEFVVLDEAQYLKSRDAGRTKAILGEKSDGIGGIMQWAVCAYWLTGTPIPNDPIDIYTFLRFTGAMPLTPRQFIDRYFHSRERTYGATYSAKEGNVDELRRLIGNNSIQRRLDDVGVYLPPIWVTTMIVDGDTREVNDLLLAHPGLDKEIIQTIEEKGSIAKIDSDYTSTLRRLLGEAKAIPYAELLLWELRNGLDKMVVFGISRAALNNLRNYLVSQGIKTLLLNGDTPDKQRQPMIDQFQSDPSTRVIALNMRAGGVGHTLTASNRIDILESDWSPAGNAQALKRVHRLTQGRPVHARFISLARSFDEQVTEIVAAKAANIAAIEGREMVGAA